MPKKRTAAYKAKLPFCKNKGEFFYLIMLVCQITTFSKSPTQGQKSIHIPQSKYLGV